MGNSTLALSLFLTCVSVTGVYCQSPEDYGMSPLIKDASQLSTPFGDDVEGTNIGMLCDGDPTTFWYGVTGYNHWLQVDFEEPVFGDLILSLTRHPNVSDDQPTGFHVIVSDNAKDWYSLGDPYVSVPFGEKGATDLSYEFRTSMPINHIRFSVVSCYPSLRAYWSAAEFQLYGNNEGYAEYLLNRIISIYDAYLWGESLDIGNNIGQYSNAEAWDAFLADLFFVNDWLSGNVEEELTNKQAQELVARIENNYQAVIESRVVELDESEWSFLQLLCEELIQLGWSSPWDFSQGISYTGAFQGVKMEQGHVVGLDLRGQNLSGLFPTTIFAFPALRSIDLSENNLAGDLPVALSEFVAKNPSLTANITSLNISHNHYSGNVGILAQCFPNLTSLDCSDNCFEDVYPMISPNVTELKLGEQTMSRVIELDMANVKMEELVSKIPSILFYNHEQQTFNNSINMLFTAADIETFDKETSTDWAMQIAYSDGQFSIPYVSRQNAYYGNSGDMLKVMALNLYNEFEGSTFKMKFLFEKGDANFINGVDATDLQATILYAFDEYKYLPFNFTAANTYIDDIINVQDVVCTVNILLAGSGNSVLMARDRQKTGQDEAMETDASLYIRDGKIILKTNTPIAVIDIKAGGEIRWNVEQYGMIQSTKQGNLVGYSLSGTTLPIGETVIGTCASDASIRKVSLADSHANAVSVSIGEDSPTSISDIDEKQDVRIYELSGRKQNNMKSGVNIVNKNGQVIKVINK